VNPARDYNLLVLSDLHLGCDVKRTAPLGDPRRGGLDRALVQFLDHHATRRAGGRRWRLLLAGDVFDFVAVTAMPSPRLTARFAVGDEEHRYGLAPEEEKCVWKLRRIAARHEEVFHALARFLVAGHDVQFIRGNHDAELQFPSVQRELVRLLSRRAGVEGEALRALEERVRFHAWFYLEPGLLYLEHGNAHDRYCLQTGFFDERPCNSSLELPMSSKVLRYFANRWARDQEDLDSADQMSVREYLAWVLRMGNPILIAADYFAMVIRVLLPIAKETVRGVFRPAATMRKAALVAVETRRSRVRAWLAQFLPASRSQADRLFAAASKPAEQSLFATAQLFYVDRMALLALTIATGVGGIVAGHGATRLLLPLIACALFALINPWLARQRRCDANLLLRDAAARIAGILDVRYVAMGHSHQRVDEALSETTRYLNLGAWTQLADELPHLALIDDRAELRAFVAPPARRSALFGHVDQRHALAG
jgi:UDP-2,3-diacylglucosamine pyrophosphatase LpxH